MSLCLCRSWSALVLDAYEVVVVRGRRERRAEQGGVKDVTLVCGPCGLSERKWRGSFVYGCVVFVEMSVVLKG